MTGKFKFILMLIVVFCSFILLQVIFFKTHKNVSRSATSLLNQYYSLKTTNPLAARRTLEVLIKQNPRDQTALRELAFWYLNEGDVKSSLTQFEAAYQNDANDQQSALQLSKLYIVLKETDKAYNILSLIAASNSAVAGEAKNLLSQLPLPRNSKAKEIKSETPLALTMKDNKIILEHHLMNTIQSHFSSAVQNNHTEAAPETNEPLSNHQIHKPAAASTISDRDKMMNEFYALKRENSPAAWNKINAIVLKYPNDVQALKEAGYYALMMLKSDQLSVKYFLRVYQLTNDPKIALQLGYIYDKLRQKRIAYYYFDLATNTTDIKDRMSAEISKTNLRGAQTIFLPFPYYAALDFSPLYMSRFKLMIYPIIFQLGIVLNEKYNWKLYLSYRRTSDNKSNTNNQISSIFEDDAAITAIGSRIAPLQFIPQLIAFAEWGKSIDLVYRHRARYRTDFRGGLAYYNEWGRPAEYTLKPIFMLQPNADLYADAIYYNRYHDGIATARLRPGLKVFRYGSMSLDLYYRIFIIEDQARQFYNNILEFGPGLAFRISDRYNIVFRYEQIHGRYLPAGSPSPNPYSNNYHNGVTQLNTYFEF